MEELIKELSEKIPEFWIHAEGYSEEQITEFLTKTIKTLMTILPPGIEVKPLIIWVPHSIVIPCLGIFFSSQTLKTHDALPKTLPRGRGVIKNIWAYVFHKANLQSEYAMLIRLDAIPPEIHLVPDNWKDSLLVSAHTKVMQDWFKLGDKLVLIFEQRNSTFEFKEQITYADFVTAYYYEMRVR
jgi:hypothetical protein